MKRGGALGLLISNPALKNRDRNTTDYDHLGCHATLAQTFRRIPSATTKKAPTFPSETLARMYETGGQHSRKFNNLVTTIIWIIFKDQLVPRRKHSVSVTKTNQFMLYKEITSVRSEIHTEHINTLCGHNTELLNVKSRGTWKTQA
jgi:hypothetical protein